MFTEASRSLSLEEPELEELELEMTDISSSSSIPTWVF
jgi:hypothetical protein